MASNVEQSIKAAFRQLVFETPIEKITVSQICERAAIARKTSTCTSAPGTTC